jgi:hypothetical protein
MNSTKKTLKSMLLENTGKSMYEKNAARHFETEKHSIYEAGARQEKLDLTISHNTYHWLLERIIYDAQLTAKFNRFAKRPQYEYESWPAVIQAFIKNLRKTHEITGLYGESPSTWGGNTYNDECTLDQTLQFEYFEIGGIGKLILQIHGGGDVRGGYTAPRILDADDSFFRFADATLCCQQPNCNAAWHTDDTYHFYSEGDYSDLAKYICTDLDDHNNGEKILDTYKQHMQLTENYLLDMLGPGKHLLVIDHQLLCPVCYGDLLVAGF